MKFSEIVATEYRFEIRQHEGLFHIAGTKKNLIQGEVRDLPSYCQALQGHPLREPRAMDAVGLEVAIGDASAPWCDDCRAGFIQWNNEKKEAVQAHCGGKVLAKQWLQEAGAQD